MAADPKRSAGRRAQVVVQPHAPLVFISHDSEDAVLARRFGELLHAISIGQLKTFCSSDPKTGIPYGQQWFPILMQKLSEASDVVCLLTKNSLNRPWILYEAGAAAAALNNKPIIGLVLGVSIKDASSGPFSHFQLCGDTLEQITEVVIQLAARLPAADPRREYILPRVEEFRAVVPELLRSADSAGQPTEPPSHSAATAEASSWHPGSASFQSQLTDVIESALSRRVETPPAFAPPHLLKRFNDQGAPHLAFLAAISPVREEFPWVYELGLEVFRVWREPGWRLSAESQLRELWDLFVRCFEDTLATLPEQEGRAYLFRDVVEFLKARPPDPRWAL